MVAFAHADNEMCAEPLGAEDLRGGMEDFPIFVPTVRGLHAAPTRAVEHLWIAGIQRDGENLGAEIVQFLHVQPRHGSWVRKDRHRHMLDAFDPFLQHDAGVVVGARVRDHADAHAVEASAIAARGDNVDHLVVRNCRPVDANEVAVGIIAFGLAMTRKPAIGAIGPAALRICEQQVQTTRAAGAVHVAVHDAERDRRRGRHLDVFRRTHVGRKKIVVRQVDARRAARPAFSPARHCARLPAPRRAHVAASFPDR